MLAIDRPIEAAMVWPATTMAATAICNMRPIIAPMNS